MLYAYFFSHLAAFHSEQPVNPGAAGTGLPTSSFLRTNYNSGERAELIDKKEIKKQSPRFEQR